MKTDERLQYLQDYFAKDEKVKVEIPPNVRVTNGVTIITRFEGTRAGYHFRNGIAWFDRKDLHKVKAIQPTPIVHDPLKQKGSAE